MGMSSVSLYPHLLMAHRLLLVKYQKRLKLNVSDMQYVGNTSSKLLIGLTQRSHEGSQEQSLLTVANPISP